MTRFERALQQATMAVAVFDAGWPVPAMQLLDDLSDELSPIRATIGTALANLDAIAVDARPAEAATGLRLLIAFVLAPGVLGGRPHTALGAEAHDYAMHIASYVPGVAPGDTLREAIDLVGAWLGAPAVQGVIRAVAGELERRRVVSGVEIVQFIRQLLPAFGIHVEP